MWKTKSWMAFDFEATGTDPLTDRSWQAGAALQAQRGKPPGGKAVWINPGREYAEVKLVLNITPDECALIDGAPRWEDNDGLKDFVTAVNTRSIVAGWNCGPRTTLDGGGYDGPMLASECKRAGWECFDRPLVDVMMLACQVLSPRPPTWQQPDVAKFLGIEFEGGAHRADADSVVTLRILEHIAPQLPDNLPDLYLMVSRACGWSWWIRETPGGLQVNCGKHKGLMLEDVPRSYLRYVSRFDDMKPAVVAAMAEVLGA